MTFAEVKKRHANHEIYYAHGYIRRDQYHEDRSYLIALAERLSAALSAPESLELAALWYVRNEASAILKELGEP